MRQSALLEFDDFDSGCGETQYFLFLDVIDQLFFLQMENSCDHIGTIGSRQVVWDIGSNFPPLGIASKRQKKSRFKKSSTNCHRVLIVLFHGSRTTNKGRRKNVDRANFRIVSRRSMVDIIHETGVLCNMKLFLVFSEVFYTIRLNLNVRVDNILLSEGTPSQNVIEITVD